MMIRMRAVVLGREGEPPSKDPLGTVSDTGQAAECDNELIRLYNNDTYAA